jgi:hypothetical protein
VGFKKPRAGVSTLPDAASSDDEEIESNLEALLNDEISSYNTTQEGLLKKKPKSKKRPYSNDSDEEQVWYIYI